MDQWLKLFCSLCVLVLTLKPASSYDPSVDVPKQYESVFYTAENAPVNSVVFVIPDSLSWSRNLTYSQLSKVQEFKVASNGTIYLQRPLNFLTKSRYSLSINVKNSTTRMDKYKLSLKAVVWDVDDNSPFFPNNSYTETIESTFPMHHEILRVTALDVDTVSSIHYSLPNADIRHQFTIDSNSGAIRLAKSLDNSNSTYTFDVAASDDKNDDGYASVTINVLAPPSHSEYNAELTEPPLIAIDPNSINYFSFTVDEKILIVLVTIALLLIVVLMASVVIVCYSMKGRRHPMSQSYSQASLHSIRHPTYLNRYGTSASYHGIRQYKN